MASSTATASSQAIFREGPRQEELVRPGGPTLVAEQVDACTSGLVHPDVIVSDRERRGDIKRGRMRNEKTEPPFYV
jgi:hypothetical protein